MPSMYSVHTSVTFKYFNSLQEISAQGLRHSNNASQLPNKDALYNEEFILDSLKMAAGIYKHCESSVASWAMYFPGFYSVSHIVHLLQISKAFLQMVPTGRMHKHFLHQIACTMWPIVLLCSHTRCALKGKCRSKIMGIVLYFSQTHQLGFELIVN